MSAFQWTPERTEELMRLSFEGHTTYQLAAYFGVSRGTVSGKIFREKCKLGLLKEPDRSHRIRNRSKRKAMKESDPGFMPMLALVPDESRLASIIDATGCKWPVRDDAAFVGGVAFCNHAQKDGSSYCAHHAQINKAPYSDELLRRTYKQINFILKRAA